MNGKKLYLELIATAIKNNTPKQNKTEIHIEKNPCKIKHETWKKLKSHICLHQKL